MKSRVSVYLLLGLCLTASAAHAQIARVGNTFATANAQVRGSAIGYDSINDVYLTVGGDGTPRARFVSADGAVLGQEIPMSSTSAQFPNVAYSPDTGAFLVTWHSAGRAWAQLIKYPSGLASAAIPVSPGDFVYEITGAPVAYSPVAKEFLVVFRNYATFDILGVRVGNDGLPIGAAFSVSASASRPEPFYRNSPSIAYNPSTDEFFVGFRGGVPSGAYVRRVKPGPSQMLIGEPILLGLSADIFVTAVAYMPATRQMLAAWHQIPPDAVMGRVINPDGSLAGNVIPMSSRYGTYDSLSIGANGVSGTILLAGHDKLDVEDGGVEINTTGVPIGTGMQLTAAGGRGNFHPEVAGHNRRREWLMSAANGFLRTIAQRVSTGTIGGELPPPPPPNGTNPKMGIDSPVNDATVTGPFTVIGWAVDLGAELGTGIDAVEIWAYPAGGPEFFVGNAGVGIGRPDACAGFGAHFANCGFQMTASLPPGIYHIKAFPHSTVANAHNQVQSVLVRVPFPPNERVAIGLGPHPDTGGWMTVRNGPAEDVGVGNWRDLGWPNYLKTSGGLRLASGDVDGDGLDEIVAGLGPGGNGWLAVFDDAQHGFALLKWIRMGWTDYDLANGETFPAVGDLDGDGKAEIVVGLGTGGKGWVEIFGSATTNFAHLAWHRVEWLAYDNGSSGATHPAVGNIDGVGASEIIIGLGPGSQGFVEIVEGAAGSYNTRTWVRTGWPDYNAANGTTFPAAGDLDGDGSAELVLGLGEGGRGWLEIIEDANHSFAYSGWIRTSWSDYNQWSSGETHPAVGNIDGDSRAEIVVGLGFYAGDGGWYESFDDGTRGYASLGWENVNWEPFRLAGGATYPAIGRFR